MCICVYLCVWDVHVSFLFQPLWLICIVSQSGCFDISKPFVAVFYEFYKPLWLLACWHGTNALQNTCNVSKLMHVYMYLDTLSNPLHVLQWLLRNVHTMLKYYMYYWALLMRCVATIMSHSTLEMQATFVQLLCVWVDGCSQSVCVVFTIQDLRFTYWSYMYYVIVLYIYW